MAMNPMVPNPARMRMGRTLPAARNPNIVVAVPALVTVNPYKSRLRRHAAIFNYVRWGAYANRNLRETRRQGA